MAATGPAEPDGRGVDARASFEDWVRRALGLRDGLKLEARLRGGTAQKAATIAGSIARARFLVVDVDDASGGSRPAFLRLAPLAIPPAEAAGRASLDEWRREHHALRAALRPLHGALRPMTSLEAGPPFPAVLPPLYFCKEKDVWIGVVCPGCSGPALADDPTQARCPACGSPGGAGDPAADPKATLWQWVRAGKTPRKGAAAAATSAWIPCLTCSLREECYPAAGPSDAAAKAGERLEAVVDAPCGAALVEPFDLPLRAWLRLASGERWSVVRQELSSQPAAHVARVDALVGRGRTTVLGPEHGTAFALETFLLRLELLRQLLASLHGLAEGPGFPHLGLAPETVWIGLAGSDVWGAALWTSRVRLLETTAARESAGAFVPPPERLEALVPPECRGGSGAWLAGRCLPRGGVAKLREAKTWEFNFIPSEPQAVSPPRGSAVRFAAAGPEGPQGQEVTGRVDVAFPEVWMVTVDQPARFERTLEELLGRDDGRPMIGIQQVRDHAVADDLYAVGTMWLATLLADPGSLEGAARLREILKQSAAKAGPSYVDAAEHAGLLVYRTREDVPDRHLPPDLLEAALSLGNRLCGGVPAAFPGQAHEPIGPGERAQVYAALLAEVGDLGRSVRDRIFGYSAADAEIRALLEGSASRG